MKYTPISKNKMQQTKSVNLYKIILHLLHSPLTIRTLKFPISKKKSRGKAIVTKSKYHSPFDLNSLKLTNPIDAAIQTKSMLSTKTYRLKNSHLSARQQLVYKQMKTSKISTAPKRYPISSKQSEGAQIITPFWKHERKIASMLAIIRNHGKGFRLYSQAQSWIWVERRWCCWGVVTCMRCIIWTDESSNLGVDSISLLAADTDTISSMLRFC